jgi:ATP-dependent protease ClpP protease subunit
MRAPKIFKILVFFLMPSANAQEFTKLDNGIMRMSGEITDTTLVRFIYEYTSWEIPPLKFEISSNGGNVIEAMALGRFIRESRIPVAASGDCLSACFFIYMGGVERSVNRGGRLGLHRPYFNKNFYSNLTTSEAERVYEENAQRSISYLKEMGTPQESIERMFKTSSSSMFYLSPEESHDLLGDRAPFYEEWIFAKCGEPTKEDFEIGYSNFFLNQIEKIGAENATDEMFGKALLAIRLKRDGKLDGLIEKTREKLDCIKDGDNEHIIAHHSAQKEKLERLLKPNN